MSQYKVTFVGDIMCERLLLKASQQKRGGYDFSPVFANMQELFSQADFVIGNLETPLAGEAAVYTNEMYSFNTPDTFADAVKQAGIDLVAIANNHCLDRNVEGLCRTIRVLDDLGLPHCGTKVNGAQDQEATYFSLGNTKFAVINYTYGTNYALNKMVLPEDSRVRVNLLRAQQESVYLKKNWSDVPKKRSFPSRVKRYIWSRIPEEQALKLKKLLKKPIIMLVRMTFWIPIRLLLISKKCRAT